MSSQRPVFNEMNTNMFQTIIVDGATTGADITVTGITPADPIILCLEFAQTSNDPTLRTAVCSENGKVRTTVATDNDKLLLLWLDVSAAGNAW